MDTYKDESIEALLQKHGEEILRSEGMQLEKKFIQHGDTSVYSHSIAVTAASLTLARKLPFKIDERSLTRGSLLHDYFLYDWHDRTCSKPKHATRHSLYALENAEQDFSLNDIERDIISHHMFPLNAPPKTIEGWILTIADKAVAIRETLHGISKKLVKD